MRHIFLLIVLTVGLGLISGAADTKTEPERVTLEQALEATPRHLARGYLMGDYLLDMVEPARKGATIHTPDGTIDSSNAEAFRAVYAERLAIYATAIKQRGYRKIAGAYSTSVTDECKGTASMLTGLVVDGMAQGITITRDDFKVKLTQNAEHKGETLSISHYGILVEGVLVVVDATAPDFTFFGTVEPDEFGLRPWVADIQATYSRYPPNFPPRPNWEALSKCVLTLKKERN